MLPTENEIDDQELEMNSSKIVSRLSLNGQSELAELFVKLRPLIREMIEKRMDRRLLARVDASDIVQETFVRACKALDTYLKSPSVHPVVWIRLIGKHLLAETHRHHFRGKRSPAKEQNWEKDSSELLVNRIADSMHSVGSAIEKRERMSRVRELIEQLAPIDREIIEMRHVEGLNNQQVAQSLQISSEAAKKRYFRALKRFREIANG